MNKLLAIGATTVTTLALTAATTGTALAWHPQGSINKAVQNETQNGQFADANTAANAVSAKTGDVLNYKIVITNSAKSSDGIDNSMRNTVLNDTLPAGVELVSNASQRTITENIGTVAPGKSVTKTYKVKVTSTKDGDVITNQACFVGDAELGDKSQKACDTAVFKVTVPKTETPVTVTPETPKTETPAPVQGKSQEAPAALPNTGISPIVLLGSFASAIAGYAAYVVRARRASV